MIDSDLYAEIAAISAVLLYLLAFVSAVEAVLQGRTSQGTIAWVISLLSFPLIAVPTYLIFGRNKFDGYLEKRDAIEKDSLRLIQRTSGSIQQHVVPLTPAASHYASLYQLARMPATSGNQVKLLIDGQATFDDIAAGLLRARKYVLFQFYIIRADKLGERLAHILCDKAKHGVKVYLLYDEIGSRPFARSKLLRRLQAAGVQTSAFNTTQGRRNRLQLNFRNHRKVVVVDGQEAWIGGHNVGDEYLGLDKNIGHWRDTHAMFRGPAVLGAELAFATDWRWATNSNVEVNWDFNRTSEGNSKVLVLPSDPASVYEEAGLMYHQLITTAQERIWIASPYFVPDRSIIAAIQLAALRGVDVRILIPDEPDGPVVAMANWSYTKELLQVGVKIYRYAAGFLHQKVVLMDDIMAGVGTANFDNRSFRLNFEITLLVEDIPFARQVETMLEADMRQSIEVLPEDFADKPFWFPAAMGLARLCSPLL